MEMAYLAILRYKKYSPDQSRDIYISTDKIEYMGISHNYNNKIIQCGLIPCIEYVVNFSPDVERLNAQNGSISISGVHGAVIIYLPYVPSILLINVVEKCK